MELSIPCFCRTWSLNFSIFCPLDSSFYLWCHRSTIFFSAGDLEDDVLELIESTQQRQESKSLSALSNRQKFWFCDISKRETRLTERPILSNRKTDRDTLFEERSCFIPYDNTRMYKKLSFLVEKSSFSGIKWHYDHFALQYRNKKDRTCWIVKIVRVRSLWSYGIYGQ